MRTDIFYNDERRLERKPSSASGRLTGCSKEREKKEEVGRGRKAGQATASSMRRPPGASSSDDDDVQRDVRRRRRRRGDGRRDDDQRLGRVPADGCRVAEPQVGRARSRHLHRRQRCWQRARVHRRVLGAAPAEHDQLLPHVARRRRPARLAARHAARHDRRTVR